MEILIAAALSPVVVGWLVRSLVRHWLDKDVETYKIRLNSEYAEKIESFRHALQIQATEHEIRFRNIHEKQAEVIAGTYERLNVVYDSIRSYVSEWERSGEPTKDEKLELASSAVKEFNGYFYPKRIYFPENVAKKVDNFAKTLIKLGSRFSNARFRDPVRGNANIDTWTSVCDAMDKDVPPLLEELQLLFQMMLGIKTDTVTATANKTQPAP